MYNEELEKAALMNGEFTVDGVRYILTRPAFLDYDSPHECDVYRAYATRAEGEQHLNIVNGEGRYLITWYIDNPNCEDEAFACDWNWPAEIWDRFYHTSVY